MHICANRLIVQKNLYRIAVVFPALAKYRRLQQLTSLTIF
jgi:hypothetical protein